ncbi:hypothetical protein [Streptomyces cavernae]|uniref:hypothetical protein n=1 Tax=Streptomyces cavernae TaxID=2259034 RepID=UPI000FEBB544|nr:hypothetical protein [Streptomyces cavernae]
MTPPSTKTGSPRDRNARLPQEGRHPLWRVCLGSFVVFLCALFLAWANAYVINDDLPNFCGDVRRSGFPPEVACVAEDGTVTGATPGWVEVLFFGSLTVCVLFAVTAFAVSRARKQ